MEALCLTGALDADFVGRLSSLRVLYVDSMAPRFLGTRAGDTTDVTRLCAHVGKLPPAAAAGLIQELQAATARVWGGEEACALQLEHLLVSGLWSN